MNKKLQAGDEVTYEINGEKLVLTPMPWGKMKKVLKLFSESWETVDQSLINDTSKFLKWLTGLIETRMNDLFPLLIDDKRNPFFNQDWVDNNITLMHIKQIISDSIDINGVKDFLALTRRENKPSQEVEKETEKSKEVLTA